MSRGGLSQATPAGSVEAASQAVWQGNMPACNRRRAFQIRRYSDPNVRLCGRGQRVLPTGERGLSQTSWTERQLVPSGDGR
jgi:hypothetical protein